MEETYRVTENMESHRQAPAKDYRVKRGRKVAKGYQSAVQVGYRVQNLEPCPPIHVNSQTSYPKAQGQNELADTARFSKCTILWSF